MTTILTISQQSKLLYIQNDCLFIHKIGLFQGKLIFSAGSRNKCLNFLVNISNNVVVSTINSEICKYRVQKLYGSKWVRFLKKTEDAKCPINVLYIGSHDYTTQKMFFRTFLFCNVTARIRSTLNLYYSVMLKITVRWNSYSVDDSIQCNFTWWYCIAVIIATIFISSISASVKKWHKTDVCG